MAKISVILPSYNVGKYIGQCMESVINQDFSDLEILCVDAGSTDGTLEILKDYSKKDARVRLIMSEKKSYGYQVNIGISKASGKYVGIVETDDYIEPDMYQLLYRLMEEEPVDFVKGTALFCYDLANEQTYHKRREGQQAAMFSQEDEVVTIGFDQFPEMLFTDFYLWNGLYAAEMIRQIRLSNTPGAAYQDTGFLYQLYTKAQKGRYVNHPVYHYRKTNKDASAYDIRALANLRYEYGKILASENEMEEKWKRALAMKAFFQIRRKLYLMGYQGRYWTEAEQDLQALRTFIMENTQSGDFLKKYREDVGLFFEDAGKLYDKFYCGLKEKKAKVNQVLTFASKRPFALIGASLTGRFVLSLLLANGIKPVAVCDNAETKIGTKWTDGYRVISPKEVLKEWSDAAFIITTQKKESAAAIEEQLIGSGVCPKDIVIYDAGTSGVLLLGDHEII